MFIIECLKYSLIQKELFLPGDVIMPTHLHLITSNREEVLLSDIMRDFRAFTSRRIREQIEPDRKEDFLQIFEQSASKPEKQQYRIWTDDYLPAALRSEKWFN